jgi:hypothetical protein
MPTLRGEQTNSFDIKVGSQFMRSTSSRASPVVGEAQRIGSQISGRLAPARSQPCASPTLVARSSDRSSRERK